MKGKKDGVKRPQRFMFDFGGGAKWFQPSSEFKYEEKIQFTVFLRLEAMKRRWGGEKISREC